ncbi:MAG: efflux RND transporter periplasmic adaptor subunit [Rhodoferax sp.]|nr:efflux RND transporter periplasmic adaptor subunit [Rhodoferax sp.]MDP3650267.1 efflux RND transporter periplasmic adaptor subunit [Rhodoferax sp.]
MKFLNFPFGAHRLLTCGACGSWLVMAMLVAPAMAQSGAIPTVVAQARVVGSVYELDGVIQAVKQSTLSAQASGRIAVLLVKAGDRVRAGQLLATIDDREAMVGVQKSQAQINQAQAELRNAQAHLERTRDLQSKGFVSKAALDTADAQYQGGVAARDQAAAAAKQSSISQGFTRVSAPYDGWVLQTHAQAGDLAVPGAPLVTVYAPQPLRAVVQVPGSRTQVVRTAAQTTVQVDDTGGASQWIAPVARSAVPSADPVAQTTEWRLELPAKESAALVPGQQVRVRFSQAQAVTAPKLLLPPAAILRRGELTAVYLASASGFALRAVRLGAQQGADGVEVLAGVAAGDVVALDPIRAGMAPAISLKSKK